MNNIKSKLFPIILFSLIVVSSVVMFFSSGDSTQPEVVVGSMQDIVHTCSKFMLIVASILALVYMLVSAEHNANEIKRIKNTWKPKQ